MVFSFFRKDKQTDAGEDKAEKKPSATPASKPMASATQNVQQSANKGSQELPGDVGEDDGFGGYSVSDGIEVSEGNSAISSVAEEAAIFYANNLADQAAATLLNHVNEPSSELDIQPWLMLFDLFSIQGKKPEFEELALNFVVKFERSAPIWVERNVPVKEVSKAAAPASANYCALTGVLSVDSEPKFQQMMQIGQKAGNLRLDLSKVTGLEAYGSRKLLESLQGLRKSGIKIQYIGTTHIVGLLNTAMKAGIGEDAQFHWLLALEFDQLLGKEESFEELAIEYAVTFEVSPPSWEPLVGQAVMEESVEEPAETDMQASERPQLADAFVMTGVISGNSEQILKELLEYGLKRQDVRIDMSKVLRVDFICVGNFLNALIQLSTSGKQIFIREPNELIHALFSVMGVDQFATFLKKKAH
ncbi:STAS domain-containing protein [Sulfurirhabdus autotrophica]|uniref:STAS domain-containing protein n=1 Tax=Sulfurirhabdus autotrophica TaxID=1706046 RepID=A0A4R3XZD9_9PROT|nr:STAS domain-containing protein [Sulfurirhabdus autotrophica]TCV85145.1 STAS domain-containing protein [Sulfurirhabdus autotrophica]